MEPASWVIREKATGKVILETFDKKKVEALNIAKYEAVSILEYLASLNRQLRGVEVMPRRAELERVLQGQDPIANALIGHLFAQGWSGDFIVKNVAIKVYPPHQAVVRVMPDLAYQQYWVKGEYHSKGENVLSTCTAWVKATASPEEMADAMSHFLREAESRISESFAVRFLGGQSQVASLKM